MSKKVLMVTNHNAKDAPGFEKTAKEIYLDASASEKQCITFMHQMHEKPHLIAEKAKDKKVAVIVFDETVPLTAVTAIRGAVAKKMSDSSPKCIHVCNQNHAIDGVLITKDHTSANALCAN